MKRNHIVNYLTTIILTTPFLTSCNSNNSSKEMKTKVKVSEVEPPVCKEIPKKLEKFNDVRIDNYYWLKERENPEVIAYLEQENKYTEEKLKHTKGLQENLFKEMKARIKEDDSSAPLYYNGYYYITRNEQGKEYPIIVRKKYLNDEEEVLLECNEMAKPYDYFELGDYDVSPNNKILAYSTDTVSRRLYTIYLKDLTGEKNYEEKIPNTTGTIVWANDNKTIYYTLQDTETLRPNRVMKHRLGTSIDEDVLVYEEKDEVFSTGISKTKTNKYIIIGSYSTLTQEYRLINADNTEAPIKLFAPRKKGLEYDIFHHENEFFIRTNLNAENFRIMTCSEDKTQPENWKEFTPYNPDILTEELEIFKDFLVVGERKKGLTQLKVINLNDHLDYYIHFNDEAYTAYIGHNPEYDTTALRYGYTSLTTPFALYRKNMETQEQEIIKQEEVVGGHNPEDYISKRLYAPSRDGKQIPISIVYKKTTQLNEHTPLLQYGYGSYGVNVEPNFSKSLLSLLDRGFVYAIAHVRGSQTLGREWYEDGKFLKKKNTFFDFIDCSKYLLQEGYTSAEHLYAEGGSAGGLLMGAISNYNPELYKGIIAQVPFVDVLTTMLDPNIPLTTGEYEEWGNPNEEEYYFYIKSYSPYDNVEKKEYPNILVTTGLHDSQVQYWEPAKWVAKLRELKTDDNTLLLKTNMDAGHGGASGRFEYLKEIALNYAFLLDLENK